MAPGNGETFDEIRKILENGKKIPSHVGLRLTLAALADMRENQQVQAAEIKELQQDSILRWAKNNKIVAVVLAALIVSGPADTLWNMLQLVITKIK